MEIVSRVETVSKVETVSTVERNSVYSGKKLCLRWKLGLL